MTSRLPSALPHQPLTYSVFTRLAALCLSHSATLLPPTLPLESRASSPSQLHPETWKVGAGMDGGAR